MPLTLAEIHSLIAALGVTIREAILAEKAKTEDFKTRQEKISAEAVAKPPDWRLKADFEAVVGRAVESADKKEFDSAFKSLDEAGALLLQPDVLPPPPPPQPPPVVSPQEIPAKASEEAELPLESTKEAYEKTLAGLMPEAQKAMKAGGEPAKAIKALLADAKRYAGDEDYDQALATLDDLELLLLESRPPSNVAFQKMQLRWRDGKKRVAMQIADLQKALLLEFNDEEAAAGAKKLDQLLVQFDAGLADTLDDFTNAAVGDHRADLKDKAVGIIERYLEFIDTAPLIDHIQANPFLRVSVRDTLRQPLMMLHCELQKGGA